MLLTPWRDPGKSWFSPGDSGPGSPEPGRDAGLGFPQLWLIPGAGEGGESLPRAPCFGCSWHKGVRGLVRAPMDSVG